MARLGRYFVKDQKLHVIQRGNNRQRIFFADADDQLYRHWLAEAAARRTAKLPPGRKPQRESDRRQLLLL